MHVYVYVRYYHGVCCVVRTCIEPWEWICKSQILLRIENIRILCSCGRRLKCGWKVTLIVTGNVQPHPGNVIIYVRVSMLTYFYFLYLFTICCNLGDIAGKVTSVDNRGRRENARNTVLSFIHETISLFRLSGWRYKEILVRALHNPVTMHGAKS